MNECDIIDFCHLFCNPFSLCWGGSAKMLIEIEAGNGNMHKELVRLIFMRELLHASDNSKVSE